MRLQSKSCDDAKQGVATLSHGRGGAADSSALGAEISELAQALVGTWLGAPTNPQPTVRSCTPPCPLSLRKCRVWHSGRTVIRFVMLDALCYPWLPRKVAASADSR